MVEFELAVDLVVIRRAPNHGREYLFAVFHEWAGAVDEDAFPTFEPDATIAVP